MAFSMFEEQMKYENEQRQKQEEQDRIKKRVSESKKHIDCPFCKNTQYELNYKYEDGKTAICTKCGRQFNAVWRGNNEQI